MRSLNSWSLRLRILSLSAIVTLICVVAGGYITRALVERENDFNKRMRPHARNYIIMRELIKDTGISAPDVFRIIEKQPNKRTPYLVMLVDAKANLVDFYPEPFPMDAEKSRIKKYQISPGYYVIYYNRGFGRVSGSSPFRFRGGPNRVLAPPGAHVVGIVAVGVSILVGLLLSTIFLTMYVRGKSQQAEVVISKLRSGDLKARFKINQVDESSLLMQKFNEMADQIEELVSNLRSTEKARMILLQELAHDLRTPVASLKNLQELLLEKGHLMDEDKRRHAQGLAVKEVLYFERLVEDLLFLSGVNDPRYSGNFKQLSLKQLIAQEVELFESDKIQFEIVTETEAMISGDEHLLRRLIKNALSNASKFAHSRVEISLSRTEETTVVAITDDGPGIDAAQIKLFGEKKYSRRIEEANANISIGLGSVIMKKIMSLHDGKMVVENVRPTGLRIIFSFS